MNKWQPIETMPKKGNFLVFIPWESPRINVAQVDPIMTIIGGLFSRQRGKPTHWMPLPAEPWKEEPK